MGAPGEPRALPGHRLGTGAPRLLLEQFVRESANPRLVVLDVSVWGTLKRTEANQARQRPAAQARLPPSPVHKYFTCSQRRKRLQPENLFINRAENA